jgi:hypothetical protein
MKSGIYRGQYATTAVATFTKPSAGKSSAIPRAGMVTGAALLEPLASIQE